MGRRQILVVEDDHSIREVLTHFLEAVHDVRTVTTGAEALAILNEEDIALIVLEYRLPDCTGLELLVKIKATWPSRPVIMITGYGSEWLCTSAFRLGVRDYFAKPFDARELIHAVCRILAAPVPTQEQDDYPGVVGSRTGLLPALSASYDDLVILKSIKLIQERYWDRVSLSELARELGIGKYTLSRRFRQVMGMPFRNYLLRLRLEKAKALLGTTGFSITEVAQMVGFGDLPRFDKLFKRYTGVTPSLYRHRELVNGNKTQIVGK